MKKVLSAIILVSLFISNLSAVVTAEDTRKIKSEITPTSVTASLDLGLNKNLFGAVDSAVQSVLDSIFNPVIQELKEIRRKNIQTIGFEYEEGEGIKNMWMNLIGLKDGLFTRMGLCNPEDTTMTCNSNSKSIYFQTSSLNPLNDLRETFKAEMEALNDEIKQLGKDFRKEFTSQWDKVVAPFTAVDKSLNRLFKLIYKKDVFYDYLIDELTSDEYANSNIRNNQDLKSFLTNTKTANQIIMERLKDSEASQDNALFDYTNVQTHIGGNVNVKSTSNNLCDLAFGLFDKSNTDLQTKMKDQINRIRKELYKYAAISIVKKLMTEMEIITTIQQLQKIARCAVEATVSIALAKVGISDMDWGSTLSSISGISNLLQTSISTNSSTSNSSSIDGNNPTGGTKNYNETVAKCMDQVKNKTKTETNIKATTGLQSSNELVSALYVVIWEHTPFSTLSLGINGQTNKISQALKEPVEYSKCVLEGVSAQFGEAFTKCVDSESQTEFKIRDKLRLEIARLFDTVRKSKKKNCEFLDSVPMTNVYNFSAIIDTNRAFVPSQNTVSLTPPANDTGTWDFFTAMIGKLAQNKIEIFQHKTAYMSILLESFNQLMDNVAFISNPRNRIFKDVENFINCGGVYEANPANAFTCEADGIIRLDETGTPITTSGWKGLRVYCLETAKKIAKDNNLAELIKNTASHNPTKSIGDFTEKQKDLLADMYHCSDMLQKISKKPLFLSGRILDEESKVITETELSHRLNAKWLLLTKQISQEEYNSMIDSRIYKKALARFERYSEQEKIDICFKTDLKENLYKPSRLYKFCRQFKMKVFDDILGKAKLDYKVSSVRSLENLKKDKEEVFIEIEELRQKFNIF